MEIIFFRTGFICYAVAMSLSLGYALTKRENLAALGRTILFGGVLSHLASLVFRTMTARQMPQYDWYVPWNNWFESFSFFAFVIAVQYLIIQQKEHLPILGAFVTPLLFGMMVLAISSPVGTQIPKLQPGLHSVWMATHIPVMFISYAAFANAFALGLAYLIQEHQIKSKKPSQMAFRLPSLDELDRLIFQIILVAWPVLVLGLFLGAHWAREAWDRYWGWDAKVIWAVITLMVYASYLYMRMFGGWRGRKTVYLSLIGFCLLIFTYIGVNYLSNLHGYLSGGGR